MSISGHTYYDLGPIISYPTEIRSETLVETERYSFVAEVSAYTATDDQCGKSDGITASGTHVKQGRTIAVPSWIPFGTTVVINGVSYVCEDRGSEIKGNHLDIYMDSLKDAMEYGRKEMEVTVEWHQ